MLLISYNADVIGAIENFIDVKDIKTMYGDRKIVKFRITDGRLFAFFIFQRLSYPNLLKL